jgi:UDP-N-acetylglucosamine 2-epimerase (non-hydrolysing)
MNARLVLSDSGTISEESSILGLRAVNLRDTHERPEAMEEGAVMMVGNSTERVMSALRIIDHQGRGQTAVLKNPLDYQSVNVSEKVSRIILSYTDYVQRTVWKRH